METLQIPGENEFKLWIKEALKESLEELAILQTTVLKRVEPLISREEIAKYLNISLATLTDWMKRGLPFHKQRGRVNFLRSEVLEFVKNEKLGSYKVGLGHRFSKMEK